MFSIFHKKIILELFMIDILDHYNFDILLVVGHKFVYNCYQIDSIQLFGMSTRYDTLNVTVNQQKRGQERISRTIEAAPQRQEEQSRGDNEQKVNRFKELYFKNEKLRKQLKLLNEKLNEKLEKLKLPSVKRKAMSVDLNHVPPNKALVRELENAYKQVNMYKKQIQSLKSKEQTSENYDKLRNAENMIGYMDIEIGRVQQQLKSIKNVKKLQQRVMSEDLDNQQFKQRLTGYQAEIKSFKEKIKDIDRKDKKREVEFKKQQAYLVMLEKKLRKSQAQERDADKPEPEKPLQVSSEEFNAAKQELLWAKRINDELCKKIEALRKLLKNIRSQRVKTDQTLIERQGQHKQLLIQHQTFSRLLKDLQSKNYDVTYGKISSEMKGNSKFLKLTEIQDELQGNSISDLKNPDLAQSKLSSPSNTNAIIDFPTNKNQRQWKGKMRKVSKGYTIPTDEIFQEGGKIIGLKVFADENKFIIGLIIITKINGIRAESKIIGSSAAYQQKWEATQSDQLAKMIVSFSEQGYLSEIILSSRSGGGARLGYPNSDQFSFTLEQDEFFTGIFGGIRKLGQDVRITQIGLWITKS